MKKRLPTFRKEGVVDSCILVPVHPQGGLSWRVYSESLLDAHLHIVQLVGILHVQLLLASKHFVNLRKEEMVSTQSADYRSLSKLSV